MTIKKTLTFDIRSHETAQTQGAIDLKVKTKEDGANYLIHRAVVTHNSNNKIHTASTKTRAEVSGGGRKPWKQKGTGRARAGSNRSPLWKGGGVIFGPKPKTKQNKINKKERRLALQTLLNNKRNQIHVIDKLDCPNKKTKEIYDLLTKLNFDLNQQILIIRDLNNLNLKIATKNLNSIELTTAYQLNIDNLINAKLILIEANAIQQLGELYDRA